MDEFTEYLTNQYTEAWNDVIELYHAREHNGSGYNGSCWGSTVEHVISQLAARDIWSGVKCIEIIEEGNTTDAKYFENVVLTIYRNEAGQFDFEPYKLKGSLA